MPVRPSVFAWRWVFSKRLMLPRLADELAEEFDDGDVLAAEFALVVAVGEVEDTDDAAVADEGGDDAASRSVVSGEGPLRGGHVGAGVGLHIVNDHEFLGSDGGYHGGRGVLVKRDDVVDEEGVVVLFEVEDVTGLVEDIKRSETGIYKRRDLVDADFGDLLLVQAVEFFGQRGEDLQPAGTVGLGSFIVVCRS